MPGCDGSNSAGCDQLLNTRWSTIFGLFPVSALAVSLYLALLVSVFFIGSKTEFTVKRLAWHCMLVLIGTAVGCAIWFIVLQIAIIGKYCVYCMSTHLIGILLSILIISRSHIELGRKSEDNSESITKSKKDHSPFRNSIGLFAIGLFMAGILVIAQLSYQPPSTYTDGQSAENISSFEIGDGPMLGSANAKHVVTLLFDYQCSHCQKLHFMLNELIQSSEQIAFVLCPTPLNTKCNPHIPRDVEAFRNSCELARIGLAVWRAQSDKFVLFENWMFSYESGSRWQPRTLEAATVKAKELLGPDLLNEALNDQWIDQYLQYSVSLFGRAMQGGKGGIPKFIYQDKWVIPEANSADELIVILQNSLAIPEI